MQTYPTCLVRSKSLIARVLGGLRFGLSVSGLLLEVAAQNPFDADARAVTAALPLAVGRPAPDLGLTEWHGQVARPPLAGRVIMTGGEELPEGLEGVGEEIEGQLKKGLEALGQQLQAGRRQQGDLAQYHNEVVLVHVLDWRNEAACNDLVELVQDVITANEDLGVQAIGVMEKGERAAAMARATGLSWPIGLTTLRESSSPYVVSGKQDNLFVIGRSGQLSWQGNASVNRAGFLKALRGALSQRGVERIERDLSRKLDRALAQYYDERLEKACVLAKRGKAPRADAQQAADAHYLITKAKASELAWTRALRFAAARRQMFDDYLGTVDALVRGLPKSAGKQAQAHLKALTRKGNNAPRLRDERDLLTVLRSRPALFPAQKNRKNDRFAKSLDKFLDRRQRSSESTRRAQDLLDRYRIAAK